MPGPTPIETEAFGRLFRSRLEARCAVFLEAMDLQWEYEPEGYELPSGRYLPDFKIHDCKKIAGFYWLECKGETPSDREVKLTRELAAATRSPVVFFNSSVFEQIRRSHKIYKEFYHSKGWGAHEITDPFECWDISNDVKWLQLWDRYSVVGKEMTDLGLCEVESLWPQWPLGKTFRAANAALKARFEHGEGFS